MKRELSMAFFCLALIAGCEKSLTVNTNDSHPAVSNDNAVNQTDGNEANQAQPNQAEKQKAIQDAESKPAQPTDEPPSVADEAKSADNSGNESNCPEPDFYAYDEANLAFGEDVESTYGTVCKDGISYCYGMDNDPIAMPKEPSGWGCRHVASMPNDKKFRHEYLYLEDVKTSQILAEDDFHRVNRKYVEWAFMQAWVCEDDDGCSCGGKSCPLNTLCIDEKCYCNDKPYSGGKCTLKQPELKGISNDADVDDDEDSGADGFATKKARRGNDGRVIEDEYDYYCGNIKMVSDSEVQKCIQLADGRKAIYFKGSYGDNNVEDDYYKDLCFQKDKDGDCIIRVRNIDAERKRRADSPEYKCGKETCVLKEACLNNHCVGLGTLKPLPSNEYTWNTYFPLCIKDAGCKCGSRQCKKDEYCTDSGCTDSPYQKKIKGKSVRFAYLLTDYGTLISDSEDSRPRSEYKFSQPNETTGFEILTSKDAAACDNFTMPDKVEDYVCVFDEREDGCGEGPQTYVSSAGYFCNNPKGCTCGNTQIPQFAGCRLGKPNYDAVYQTLACHHELNHYFATDLAALRRLVDEKGWCVCGSSVVPPNMKGYECNSLAMICRLKDGCECGDAKCKFDETCVKPGECRK